MFPHLQLWPRIDFNLLHSVLQRGKHRHAFCKLKKIIYSLRFYSQYIELRFKSRAMRSIIGIYTILNSVSVPHFPIWMSLCHDLVNFWLLRADSLHSCKVYSYSRQHFILVILYSNSYVWTSDSNSSRWIIYQQEIQMQILQLIPKLTMPTWRVHCEPLNSGWP